MTAVGLARTCRYNEHELRGKPIWPKESSMSIVKPLPFQSQKGLGRGSATAAETRWTASSSAHRRARQVAIMHRRQQYPCNVRRHRVAAAGRPRGMGRRGPQQLRNRLPRWFGALPAEFAGAAEGTDDRPSDDKDASE